MKLNQSGRATEEIIEELRGMRSLDPDYKDGKLWSLVYYLGEDYTSFLNEAYHLFFSANGLNPGAFKSLKQLEKKIISIVAGILHGDDQVCGVVTSGGTESCLLAVKTYRDFARAEKGIRKPEMVVPDTAHVAWLKGAEYFGIKLHRVPALPGGGADVQAMKRKVNRNTIMLLGSAPEYPHGMIDPIAELGELAEKKSIPLHVDACVGGFLLPFMEKLGHDIPEFDFRIPGVTSISADIHKYGFAAKGASSILYRHQKHFNHQVFVFENWPGGIFASPALLGTRPGGAYAAAYAALEAQGEQGYMELARKAMQATDALKKGIQKMGLQIIADPKTTLFAFRSEDPAVDMFAVADLMEKKGWYIDRLQKPDALHAMVTPEHLNVVDGYLEDLQESVEHAKAHPELSKSGQAATYGMLAHAPFRKMVRNEVRKMFASTYCISGKDLDLEQNDLSVSDSDAGQTKKSGLKEKLIQWIVDRQRRKEMQSR